MSFDEQDQQYRDADYGALSQRVVERIFEGAMQCAERGKVAARVYVGPDVYGCLVEKFNARYMGGSLQIQLPTGPATMIMRPTLFAAAIVESDDGEPFIVEDDDP